MWRRDEHTRYCPGLCLLVNNRQRCLTIEARDMIYVARRVLCVVLAWGEVTGYCRFDNNNLENAHGAASFGTNVID